MLVVSGHTRAFRGQVLEDALREERPLRLLGPVAAVGAVVEEHVLDAKLLEDRGDDRDEPKTGY